MLSLKDIEEASFRKAGMKGYHTGDVDEFLDEVKESYEKLLNDNNVLKAKLSEALEKNRVMTSDITAMRTKMDVYRTDGDEIKHALISAHKTADATIREAKIARTKSLRLHRRRQTISWVAWMLKSRQKNLNSKP